MSLLTCIECNGKVSSFADNCPHCGCPISYITSDTTFETPPHNCEHKKETSIFDFEINGTKLKKYLAEDEEVVIPHGITEIENGAFKDCISISTVKLPDTLSRIGESAFKNCSNLSAVIIPNTVTKIERQAFACCKNLSSIKLSDALTCIGEKAFENCFALTEIAIPNEIDNIENSAFINCINLKSIELFPNKLLYIGEYAFCGCRTLRITMQPYGIIYEDSAFTECREMKICERDYTYEDYIKDSQVDNSNNCDYSPFDSYFDDHTEDYDYDDYDDCDDCGPDEESYEYYYGDDEAY